MRVLLFEWFNGGGFWFEDSQQPFSDQIGSSFFRQGRGMLEGLITDFLAGGHELVVPYDIRLDSKQAQWEEELWKSVLDPAITKIPVGSQDEVWAILTELAEKVDKFLIIAPESDRFLLNCHQAMASFIEKSLGCDLPFIELCGCKSATAARLQSRAVRVPSGGTLADFLSDQIQIRFPAILKPNEGSGSEGVRYLPTCNALDSISARLDPQNYRIEEFAIGLPISLSAICSSDRVQLLPPTTQIFDRWPNSDPAAQAWGNYLRAGYPLNGADPEHPMLSNSLREIKNEELELRARRLASQAIEALPATRGYFGIDMVLNPTDPAADCVIEINPRMTMSYVRLREICPFNIAEAILDSSR